MDRGRALDGAERETGEEMRERFGGGGAAGGAAAGTATTPETGPGGAAGLPALR